MSTTERNAEYPSQPVAKYFDQKAWLYRLFSELKPSERWFVLKREFRLIAFYIGGVLFGRFLFFLLTEAQAQVHRIKSGRAIFGMTPLEVAVLTYWALHIFLAIVVVALLFHMLFAARPRPWVKETATFIFGFIIHTAVPFPVAS
jgi:hypothetical protein